ncbi:MAG: acyl CoA:acetate/3-ketoacid CoA transferase, partial [Noviherbaspirillum sp.]
QNAKKVVFVGTFTAGGLDVAIADGQLRIKREGSAPKFVDEVEHRTFSGEYAMQRAQTVLYITERCVFRLVLEGLEIIEIAPGIDLERDVLAHMRFRPLVSPQLKMMDARIFRAGPMGLRNDILYLPLEQRLTYDEKRNVFFVNFEGFEVRNVADIENIRTLVEGYLGPLDRKVPAVVNYDNFSIAPELLDAYIGMVNDLTEHFYSRVTRYTSSAFMRSYFGTAFRRHDTEPSLFASREEAFSHLGD